MLTDVVLIQSTIEEAHIPCPCAKVGKRASIYALGTCPNTKLLPVYACSVHNLCSPFGAVVNADTVRACVQCEDFCRKERQT